MCELKYTYLYCARKDCGRCEYITETLYRCPPIKARNCNGLKQMKSERSSMESLECSIHFYGDSEEDDDGPNTEYTDESTDVIDEILKILSREIIELSTRPENIERPRLCMQKSYAAWCVKLGGGLEIDDDFDIPDLTDCDTDSDESVVSEDEYASYKASETQPIMRRRRLSSF